MASKTHHWTAEKKAEVVATYLQLGTAPLTSAVTKVPVQTIREWRTRPWWKELEGQMREEKTLELDNKLGGIVQKAVGLVADRLENGDFRVNQKTGAIERHPVALRDVHKVAMETLDRQKLLEKVTGTSKEPELIEDRLRKLAHEFAAIIQNKRLPREIEVEDAEIVEDNGQSTELQA